jgi:protein-disulfide isomerase-like protein with CxxC motif
MKIKITYYLDVISSWCFLAEPAWAALKERYAGAVDFEWKIALMDATGMPTSPEQLSWFYRRSGTIMRSPFMLNTEWLQPGVAEYPVRNFVAEAARDLGVANDRVRLALATAVLRDGRPADQWEVAAEIGAEAGALVRRNYSNARVRRKSKHACERAPPSFTR